MTDTSFTNEEPAPPPQVGIEPKPVTCASNCKRACPWLMARSSDQPNKAEYGSTHISERIPSDIKRAVRSVGYALWLDSFDDWFGLSVILRARLDARQRVKLAFMTLKSLDPDDATAVMEAVKQ